MTGAGRNSSGGAAITASRFNIPAIDQVSGDLKGRSIRGGAVTMVAEVSRSVLQTGSTIILARQLLPSDFGLVAMVTAITGIVSLFKDAGLSMATVQSERITQEQLSTLFWINVAFGAVLTLLVAGSAPLLALLYHEPRLLWITLVLATTFALSGIAVQPQALLKRQMRFASAAVVEVLAQLVGVTAGITMAIAGLGYWSLVGVSVGSAATAAVASWLIVGWVPGRPHRRCGVGSMLKFGGNITATNVLYHFSRNADRVLIGWCWGATNVGLYSAASQLLLLPINQILSPVGPVAISTLARVQGDPPRLRKYFLGCYSLVVAATLSMVALAAVFAGDAVRLLLGTKWLGAIPIFQLLVPAVAAAAIMGPLGWLITAVGRADWQLRVTVIVAPLTLLSFVLGLPFGASGVAASFSAVNVALVIPVVILMTRGTPVDFRDVIRAVVRPLLAAMIAAALGLLFRKAVVATEFWPLLFRTGGGCALVFAAYVMVLLIGKGERTLYAEAFRQLRMARNPRDGTAVA